MMKTCAICASEFYTQRGDEQFLSPSFATILTTEGGIIEDYKVYADVSPL